MMASTLAGIEKLDDPARLEKIDKLRELGIGDYIPLPQVGFIETLTGGKRFLSRGNGMSVIVKTQPDWLIFLTQVRREWWQLLLFNLKVFFYYMTR